MTDILLSPHNDDAELFSTFNLLRHRPHVIVVLRAYRQFGFNGYVSYADREEETARAMKVLDCSWEQWPYPDDDRTPWPQIQHRLEHLAAFHSGRVFAPAVEEGGHEQHNRIGEIALNAFGPARVVPYLTYVRGFNGRSRSANRVEFEPHWPALKLRALACYESQIAEPLTRDWFLGDQWEYLGDAE